MKDLKKFPVIFSVLALFCSSADAGYLIQGAKLSRITNTDTNQAKFAVLTTGGTGPCTGGWIVFQESAFPDADTFKRAYAAVLLAFATGSTVSVYNYSDNACTGGSYVELSQ